MREPKVAAIILSLLSTVGCTGMTGMMPTGPSQSLSASQSVSSLPPPAGDTPAPGIVRQVITGAVRPLIDGGPRCYLGLYACETYNFSMQADGGVEVTLSWEGNERALMVQLYRADVGLMHEDVARRGTAPTITFRRPDLAAMDYQLRVVSLETGSTIPFTLTYSRWEN